MSFIPVDTTNERAAIEVFAAAFHDDPVMNWSCNYPDSLIPFFEFTLPVFLAHGLTYLDSENRGAASWLGPDQKLRWPVSLASFANTFRLGGPRGIYRMLRSGAVTKKHHPRKPHYYLFLIGVTPEHKGGGLGSQLMSHQLRMCDEEGQPAYLENSKEDNLAFYEGHGFRVTKEIRIARTAPPMWLMWREPRELNT